MQGHKRPGVNEHGQHPQCQPVMHNLSTPSDTWVPRQILECPVRYLASDMQPCVRDATGNAAACSLYCSLQSAGVRHEADGCVPIWAQSDGTMMAIQYCRCWNAGETLRTLSARVPHTQNIELVGQANKRGSYIATMLELGSHCRNECLHNPCIHASRTIPIATHAPSPTCIKHS